MDVNVIIKLAELVKEPRKRPSRVEYSITQIITITFIAVLAGCDKWKEIEMYAKSHLEYLQRFLPDLEAVPSHDTLERFFSLLKPKSFEKSFRTWVNTYFPKPTGTMCVDGKAIRGAAKNDPKYKDSKDPSPIDIVTLWSKEFGLSFGQIQVSQKSNEITAVPELISQMDLPGCVVTSDAMGCQKKIAEAILKTKADYLLACKGNQETLCESIKDVFEQEAENIEHAPEAKEWYHRTVSENKGHGRLERREVSTFGQPGNGQYFAKNLEVTKEWPGIRSFVRVRSLRTIVATGETSTEDRFYISSLEASKVDLIAKTVREHWSIENQLHWQLDVTFGEDDAKRIKNAALNFSVINKIALSLIKRYKEKKESKQSMTLLRKQFGWNPDMLSELLSLTLWD